MQPVLVADDGAGRWRHLNVNSDASHVGCGLQNFDSRLLRAIIPGTKSMAHHSQFEIGLVAFLLLNLTPAVAQQGIDRPAVSAVEGEVVKFGTGEPLAEAKVELSKVGEGTSYTVTTGGDGKFAFENVMPGEYRLVSTHADGFMPAEYGQRRPTGAGIPIVLTADQRTTGVQISMAQTGSISGRIFDQDGEPLGSVSVQALRSTYSVLGQRLLTMAQLVQTNDLGEYRLFWLSPGRYYISARQGGSPPFVISPDNDVTEALAASPAFLTQRTLENGDFVEEAHLPVYFPGSTDAATASPIDLDAGANIGGMDFIIQAPIRARHIRGIVMNTDTGQPAPQASVTLTPRNPSHDMIVSSGRADENGAFDIAGVIPGSYFVVAVVGEDDDLTGILSVDAASADVENVTVIVNAGIDIPGRVIFERGSSNSDGSPPRVIPEIQRVPFIPGMPPPQNFRSVPPNLRPDGSFVFQAIGPGDYRVFLRELGGSPAVQRVYLKSMLLGPLDILRDGLHIRGKPDAELEIVVGTDVATLDGDVVNQREQPVGNATVVLIPYSVEPRRLDLYRNVSSDAFGRFHVQGIAPGDYIVLAWEDVEFGVWQDPEFVRMYEGRGTRIHIGEGATENIRVTISP